MKSVLASLKPYYYYLVGEGIKKIEVRKSQPKADDWNKETYFYMSKDEKSFAKIPKEFQEKYRKHFGKVGLKFVCDNVYPIKNQYSDFVVANATKCETNVIARQSCLDFDDMVKYLGNKDGYAWHISDLVIYDKPKYVGEFVQEGDCNCELCVGCLHFIKGYGVNGDGYNNDDDCDCYGFRPLKTPPQSWCYVEEKEKENETN